MEETTTENPLPITGHTSLILLLSKIGAMFLLGLGSLISGMLPLIVARYRMRKQDGRRGITSDSSTSTNASSSTVHIHSHSPQVIKLFLFKNHLLNFLLFINLI